MAAQVMPGDTLTMSAAILGWATVQGGQVGGTSGGGTGSAPLTVQNNSGLNLEVALSLPTIGQTGGLPTQAGDETRV